MLRTIELALLAVPGEDKGSVKAITDKLNAQSFDCSTQLAVGAFTALTEHLLLNTFKLNGRQVAAILAAQRMQQEMCHAGRFRQHHDDLAHRSSASDSYSDHGVGEVINNTCYLAFKPLLSMEDGTLFNFCRNLFVLTCMCLSQILLGSPGSGTIGDAPTC